MLNKLKVINNEFAQALDTLLFDSNCPIIKKSKGVFLMNIKEQKKDSMYFIKIEYSHQPIIISNRKVVGYFEMKNKLFIVSGIMLKNLFFKTEQRNFFSYNEQNPMPTEDLPSWFFEFSNYNLILKKYDCW